MEPVSAASAIIGIVDVALRTSSAIIKYVKETKNASSEKKALADEARTLSHLLERLKDRAQASDREDAWLGGQTGIIRQFENAYDELALALKLEPETGKKTVGGKFKSFRSVATWSFTKFEVYSVLERITRLQQSAGILLAAGQGALVDRIDQRQQEALDQKLKIAIMNWLSPLQMTQLHQSISDRAEKGSGKWFLTSETYLQWQNEDEKLLWCYGIPGAGKTVLASIVLNHLRHSAKDNGQTKFGIAIIYLRYNEPEQTVENILASILKQLMQNSSSISPELLLIYEQHRERNTPPLLEEIVETLSALVEQLDRFYLILDALDECSEQVRWDLTEQILALQPKIRLLVTSRYLDALSEELEEGGFARFEIRANPADLELFIDHQIRKHRYLRKLVEKSPTLRDDIKASVMKTAENMFLLARLHLESISSAAGLSIRHVRQKLKTLPTTLTGTYEAAMHRIENQESEHRDVALKALAWLTYAFRSLSLRELQHALAIEPDDEELDEDSVMDGQSITAVCAGLVIVDRGTNIVNLVHYTAKSYFEEARNTYFPKFHASITVSCATYLTLKQLKDASIWQLVQQFPLACYAAQYMGDHARQAPEEALESEVLEVICQLLSHPDKRKPLLALLDGLALIQSGFYASGGSAAQIETEAEKYNTEGEMGALFEGRVTIETPTMSSLPGRVEVVEDIGADGDQGEDPLQRFASNSTAARSSISSTDSFGDEHNVAEQWEGNITAVRMPEVTALHLAASMGLARVASMLLGQTPNIDAIDETGKTALAVAMDRGFEKAVEFLLKSGACVDLRHEHGRSVLLLITERGWVNAGATVADNALDALKTEEDKSMTRRVEFLLAVYAGDAEAVAELLNQHQHSLPTKEWLGGDFENVSLFLAIEKDDFSMLSTLLAAKFDPDCRDNAGQTCLHRATRRGHEKALRLLVEYKADIEAKDNDKRTPWSSNVRRLNKKILNLLLELGADPNTRGLQGASELYSAAGDGELDTVKYMLDSGCSPNIKTNYDWVPLHWAAGNGHIEIAQLLIDAGADVSAQSDQDVTPLDLAVEANQTEVIQMLEKVGAKLGKDIGRWKGEWLDVQRTTQVGELDNPPPADGKIILVFDKPLVRGVKNEKMVGQYVYPSTPMAPEGYIYEVNHFLEVNSSSMSLRRSLTRATMFAYPLPPEEFVWDDVVYDIHRLSLDYQEFELKPRRGMADLLEGDLRMSKVWTGGWKIHLHLRNSGGQEGPTSSRHDSQNYLFRTTPDWSKAGDEEVRWTKADGTMLARSSWESSQPIIRFEGPWEVGMRDAIVACWVAKLWSESVVR